MTVHRALASGPREPAAELIVQPRRAQVVLATAFVLSGMSPFHPGESTMARTNGAQEDLMKLSCAALIGSLGMFALLSGPAMPADPVPPAAGFGRAEMSGSKLKRLSAAQVAERKELKQYLKSLEG